MTKFMQWGRVVQDTQMIEQGIYVCNIEGLMLKPEACNLLVEKAENHNNYSEFGRMEYCMVFKFEGRKYGKPSGQ